MNIISQDSNIFTVEIQDNDLIPLKEGDEFLLISIKNGIIGLSCYTGRKPIYKLSGFTNDNETVYVGFYQQSTKNYFIFAPVKIVNKLTHLEETDIISANQNHYLVWVDDIYQKIDNKWK